MAVSEQVKQQILINKKLKKIIISHLLSVLKASNLCVRLQIHHHNTHKSPIW